MWGRENEEEELENRRVTSWKKIKDKEECRGRGSKAKQGEK